MEEDVDATVIAMAREWPVRSTITVVIPLLFVIGQFINSYYHGVPLVYPGTVAVVFLGFSVLVTQQQLAEFRATQLQAIHTDAE